MGRWSLSRSPAYPSSDSVVAHPHCRQRRTRKVGVSTHRSKDILIPQRQFQPDRPLVEEFTVFFASPHHVMPVEGRVERRDVRHEEDIAMACTQLGECVVGRFDGLQPSIEGTPS
jgi:hypothetical protein